MVVTAAASPPRPVLMLDIDGVLAPLDRRQQGCTYRSVDAGGWQGAVTVVVEVIEALRDLITRRIVDARWLTSWENEARTCFAPAVGLPRLPVYGASDAPVRADEVWWKTGVVERYLAEAERRVMWVDDELTVHGALDLAITDTRLRLLEIDPLVGLTLDDLATIKSWATGDGIRRDEQ